MHEARHWEGHGVLIFSHQKLSTHWPWLFLPSSQNSQMENLVIFSLQFQSGDSLLTHFHGPSYANDHRKQPEKKTSCSVASPCEHCFHSSWDITGQSGLVWWDLTIKLQEDILLTSDQKDSWCLNPFICHGHLHHHQTHLVHLPLH